MATHDVVMQAQGMGIRVAKQWSCKRVNSRDTHIALHGKIVLANEDFAEGLAYPGDPRAPAREVVNCHCVLIERVLLPNEDVVDGKIVKVTQPPKSGKITGEEVRQRMLDADGNELYQYPRTDVFEKMSSPQEIADYFAYVDKYGDTNHPIDASISALPLETQKELAEGIEWARRTYRLEYLPEKICVEPLRRGVAGEYSVTQNIIRLAKGTNSKEAYPTIVHEMTHYAQRGRGDLVRDVCNQARKNLGLRSNSGEAKDYQREITVHSKDANDPYELVAYSVEKALRGKGNALAKEIARLWLKGWDE